MYWSVEDSRSRAPDADHVDHLRPCMNVLAADIGGTHARFALVRLEGENGVRIEAQRSFRSSELDDVLDGIRRFLGDVDGPSIAMASIAVAGPVENGEARLTNRGWRVCKRDLTELIGVEDIHLLNDFEALGHAVPLLADEDRIVLHEGRADPAGIVAVLGAGTGLGQALVIPRASGWEVDVRPTEGGHATFAPRTPEEWELRCYLSERHGHVSWERVLSGEGLNAIYDFLVETQGFGVDETTRVAMAEGDPAAVVSFRGMRGDDPACVRALDMFRAAFGARAGDVALSLGATGGVYLAGGIALELREALGGAKFVDAFLDKGRMRHWVQEVPVRVITREHAAILGAVVAALHEPLRTTGDPPG